MTDETQSEFPEAWKPEPGEQITGTLQTVEVIDPNGSGPYPCVTLKTSDGTLRAIHAFHQVLRNGIARRRPKVGDELSITYHGKKSGGAFNGYHSYAVSGGQDQEMNWDSWLPEGERQTQPAAAQSSAAQVQTVQAPAQSAVDPDIDIPF